MDQLLACFSPRARRSHKGYRLLPFSTSIERFLLLALPAEIRHLIFAHVYAYSHHLIEWGPATWEQAKGGVMMIPIKAHRTKVVKTFKHLAATCKSVREECSTFDPIVRKDLLRIEDWKDFAYGGTEALPHPPWVGGPNGCPCWGYYGENDLNWRHFRLEFDVSRGEMCFWLFAHIWMHTFCRYEFESLEFIFLRTLPGQDEQAAERITSWGAMFEDPKHLISECQVVVGYEGDRCEAMDEAMRKLRGAEDIRWAKIQASMGA